jgi:hypothetical protein
MSFIEGQTQGVQRRSFEEKSGLSFQKFTKSEQFGPTFATDATISRRGSLRICPHPLRGDSFNEP